MLLKHSLLGWAAGLGNPPRYVLCATIVALVSIAYVLLLGQIFQPAIYYFQDTITYHDFIQVNALLELSLIVITIAGLIGWLALALEGRAKIIGMAFGIAISSVAYITFRDMGISIIALTSLPTIVAILSYSYKAHFPVPFPEKMTRITINYLCIIFIVLASLSIGISLMGLDAMHYDPFYQVFVLFSSLSPVVVFLIIMSVPMRILLEYSGVFSSKFNRILLPYKVLGLNVTSNMKIFYLGVCIVISVILIVIPHILNEEQSYIGVDTPVYLDWISVLDQSASSSDYLKSLFVEISDGDRGISLLFMHLLVQITGSKVGESELIEIGIPLIVTPILILLTFFLCRVITNDDRTSLISSFLSAVGIQLLIGLYAGFFANLIALIPFYLSLLFLLRFLRSETRLNPYLFAGSLIVLLFTHVYTWTILTFFLLLFLFVALLKRSYPRKLLFISMIFVISSIGIDLLRSHLTGSELGMQRDLSFAQSTDVGLSQFTVRWENLVRTVQVHVGGFYSNFIFLSLVLAGLFLARMNARVWLFLGTFVSIGILPLFFGNVIVLSRVLYDIPFQIPAALALATLLKTNNGSTRLIAALIVVLAVSVVFVTNLS